MNNQSPLIPQGSFLEQKNKGRTRVKIAVFLVLAIHGIGLMALLMQGCKREADDGTAATATNEVAAASEPTNTPAPEFTEPTNAPVTPTNVAVPPFTPPPATQTVETPTAPTQPVPAPAAAATDYVIVKGDTFSSVAKKFHVSVKALLEVNPSVEPTKLKIGQSIHVPAPVAAAATPTVANDTGGSGQTYTVKSGDSLTKISGQFGVSIKALRSLNNLKTDRIVVGQKLKIPVKTPPAGTAPATNGQ